jgi:hypothetical protein
MLEIVAKLLHCRLTPRRYALGFWKEVRITYLRLNNDAVRYHSALTYHAATWVDKHLSDWDVTSWPGSRHGRDTMQLDRGTRRQNATYRYRAQIDNYPVCDTARHSTPNQLKSMFNTYPGDISVRTWLKIYFSRHSVQILQLEVWGMNCRCISDDPVSNCTARLSRKLCSVWCHEGRLSMYPAWATTGGGRCTTSVSHKSNKWRSTKKDWTTT